MVQCVVMPTSHRHREPTLLQSELTLLHSVPSLLRNELTHLRSLLTHLHSELTHPRSELPHLQRLLTHPRSELTHLRSLLPQPRSEFPHLRSLLTHPRSGLPHLHRGLTYPRSDPTLALLLGKRDFFRVPCARVKQARVVHPSMRTPHFALSPSLPIFTPCSPNASKLSSPSGR